MENQFARSTETKPVKGYKGVAMEGPIASWYAKTTQNDMQRHKFMAQTLAPHIPPGGRVLEVAPGPGYFCLELAKLGHFRLTGLDISKTFVEIAQKNALAAGLEIEFRQGDAARMPFAENAFDFIFCQAAFKNFSQPVRAIAEMHRVLSSQGVAVIVDLRKDASTAEIRRYVNSMSLNSLNRWLTNWTFKHMLLKSAYTLDQMQHFVAQTPFGKGEFKLDDIGFQLWLEKSPDTGQRI